MPAFDNTPFILSGMHRSGTSLTASILQKAGINMGKNLLGASHANIRGHYENHDFLDFHMKVLRESGHDESGIDLVDLTVDDKYNSEAKEIINRNKSELWGWKEPRTTLFLEFWNKLLPEAYFVFVYREPWEVVDSLFRRWSDSTIKESPWKAIRVWSLYNKNILNFYEKHPDRSVIFPASFIAHKANEFIEQLNAKFGLDLKSTFESPYEPSLYKKSREISFRKKIISETYPEALEVFKRLIQQGAGDLLESDESINRDYAYYDWLNAKKSARETELLKLDFERERKEYLRKNEELKNQLKSEKESYANLQKELQKLNMNRA